MPNVTTFDIAAQYVFIPVFVQIKTGKPLELDALLDTGAPRTEFSDTVLQSAGFLDKPREDVRLKPGFQTQKYGQLTLPNVTICAHEIENLTVYVSHFEKSWGIDALIGLDFFRRFRVTIDYSQGVIVSEAY